MDNDSSEFKLEVEKKEALFVIEMPIEVWLGRFNRRQRFFIKLFSFIFPYIIKIKTY